MPYFKCTFMNEQGRFFNKTLFSESRQGLEESFRNADEKLVRVRRILFHDLSLPRLIGHQIKYHEFLLFNQQLITLLRSGMPFLKALEIIAQHTKKGMLQEILSKTAVDIRNGTQISDAFSSPAIPFQRIYKASLLAGERSGHIEQVLDKFNQYLGKITQLRRKVIGSLTYPVILFSFMVVMVLVIMIFVIPKFTSFYEDFDAQLPGITLFFISVSTFMKTNAAAIIVLLALAYAGIRLFERLRPAIVIIDRLKLKIPLLGRISKENAMAIFTRTLGILISGGIPVPEAAEIAVESFANRFLYQKVRHLPTAIREGRMASDVLREVALVPPILVEMIQVGETSGNLTTVLEESAVYFEHSIDTKVNTLISLIEPVIIIMLGLVIAFMLLSVYLPIFSSVRVIE